MITIVRTNAENLDFINLIKALDIDIAFRDGEEHFFMLNLIKLMHKTGNSAHENSTAIG
jgi:hypothetical protein